MKRFKRLFTPQLTWKPEANEIDARLAPILRQVMKDYADYDPHDIEACMIMAVTCTISEGIITMQAKDSKRRSAARKRRMEQRHANHRMEDRQQHP